MEFIDLSTLEVLSRHDLVRRLPNVSLPKLLTDDHLSDHGYATITPTAPPVVSWDQRLVKGAPALNAQGIYEQTWAVEDVPVEGSEALLSDRKSRAKNDIDLQAGDVRKKVGSVGYGQEMTYIEKSKEAEDVLTDPDPETNAANYPMIKAERDTGLRGALMSEVASLILSTRDAWKAHAGEIEAVRLQAKADIEAATSIDEIELILGAITWPQM